jgi:hypothetical protein
VARMVFNDCCGSLAIEAGNAARSCTSALLRKQRFGPISAAASKENKNPRRGERRKWASGVLRPWWVAAILKITSRPLLSLM